MSNDLWSYKNTPGIILAHHNVALIDHATHSDFNLPQIFKIVLEVYNIYYITIQRT